MNKQIKTIDLKGKAYATVASRIKEFREQCPNGLIVSTPVMQANGEFIFSARILKDKSKLDSAEAVAHSIGKVTGDKAFEKLETVAVGRALAMLGYMGNGEIASGEEMEKFYEYAENKKQEAVIAMKDCKTKEELKKCYMGLGSLMGDPAIMKLKDQLKTNLK